RRPPDHGPARRHSLGPLHGPEGSDLPAEDERAPAVALRARLDHVDEADERRSIAQLVPDHVEGHARERAEAGPAAVALDALADTDQGRQEAAGANHLPCP